MPGLDRYRNARLSLDQFVEVANRLLPDLLPNDITDQRLKEELTPRLVRHYASQGGLEEPEKEGREARYTYRHLLQLLALRRLQAEGHRTGSVTPLTSGMTEEELEGLLSGGRQVTLTQAPNAALDFLKGLRTDSSATPEPPPSPSPGTINTRWNRYQIAPGLEVQVGDDFRFPQRSDDQAKLYLKIDRALRSHQGQRRSSR